MIVTGFPCLILTKIKEICNPSQVLKHDFSEHRQDRKSSNQNGHDKSENKLRYPNHLAIKEIFPHSNSNNEQLNKRNKLNPSASK